jgi:hypothetical protein
MNDELQSCRRPAMSAADLVLHREQVARSRGLTISSTERSLARTPVNLEQERVL